MVVIILSPTPESRGDKVPSVGVLVHQVNNSPLPQPGTGSDGSCVMSPAGYLLSTCSFMTVVGECHPWLAASLILIKLPPPLPESGFFFYLKWQLQSLLWFLLGEEPWVLPGAKSCWAPTEGTSWHQGMCKRNAPKSWSSLPRVWLETHVLISNCASETRMHMVFV